MPATRALTRERALLAGLCRDRRDAPLLEEHLQELGLLAETAGAEVVGRVVQERGPAHAATLLRRGKVEELSTLARERRAGLAIFDDDLSPAQVRNLEKALSLKVLDRSALILDIFARRARSREARTQVELAQLRYLLPRLTRQWGHLSRQAGGIGQRGVGETQLEIDRRLVRRRIARLAEDLARIETERGEQRKRRRAEPRVALVGYTNAGKSTLFNALTRAETQVSDQLFLTLDPLVRKADFGPGREVLLVDTVGFIQKLPHALVAAFRATLEEVTAADLLLHVIDASAEDTEEREAAVESVLREIGAADRPRVQVLNKIDLVPPARAMGLRAARPDAVLVCANTGAGLDELAATLIRRLALVPQRVRLRFSSRDARGIAGVYAAGRVVGHEVRGDEVTLEADIPERLLERYREHLQ